MADDPAKPATLSGMITTLVTTGVVALVYVAIFLLLRKSQRRYYAPRTYLGSLRDSERTPELPNGWFNWIGTYWKIPDVHVLQHQSLDAYLFIRFLRMVVLVCFVGCCITWPILWPVDATGGGTNVQLDILTFGNINNKTNAKYRYYAHVFVSWVYFGFVLYLVMRECIYYINLRQAFLLSPLYSKRMSSRTVLFTSVPAAFLDEAKLRKMFGDTVKNLWVLGDTEEVDKLVEERDKVALRLEKAEVKLIKQANKLRQQTLLKQGATEGVKAQIALDGESGSIAARWLPQNKRPSHKLGFLGLLGQKVDTINWCRTELERLIPAVDSAQAKYRAGGVTKMPSVFVEFRTQADAEAAQQVLTHHQGLQMAHRFVGVTPKEVVWKALKLSWFQKLVRGYAVNAFIAALILFWAIPVAFVGIVSNIPELQAKYSWLSFLDKIPDVIMGVITGLLPSVLLAILMSLVPIIMRLCAKLAGMPSLSRVELFTQNAYFVFQVIQVFLVATLSSSATAVATKIADNPASATSTLAAKLPSSANVYISYFIVQGITVATSVLTQVVGFFIFNLLYKFLASTPRAMYQKWANLSAISWGSTLPVYTNIAVIAITYSCIAPLVLGWAFVANGLFYLAWRYNVLFVSDTNIDTRGLIYPLALKQLLTGVYLAEVCMIGLFGAAAQPGPLILMIAFLVFTVLFHISLNNALNPLLYNLPMSLLAEEGQNMYDIEAPAAPGTLDQPKTSASQEKKPLTGAVPTRPRVNPLTKFLKPWIHADYETQRMLVPHGQGFVEPEYPPTVAEDAYYPPSATSRTPLLWIPSDPAGISKQEVAHTSRVIPITDEGCELDDKGHLVWDREATRPPVWEEKILY